jgi:hypothetical protein
MPTADGEEASPIPLLVQLRTSAGRVVFIGA